jgi:alpha-tubulin suppressor-like RCC1 family protein
MSVQCWGHNNRLQIGGGISDPSVVSPTSVIGLPLGQKIADLGAGDSHSCVVHEAGTVYCWGWNFFGQLGRGTSGSNAGEGPDKVLQLADAKCVTTAQADVVKCWGRNDVGQLGTGDTSDRTVPDKIKWK